MLQYLRVYPAHQTIPFGKLMLLKHPCNREIKIVLITNVTDNNRTTILSFFTSKLLVEESSSVSATNTIIILHYSMVKLFILFL